MALSLSEIEQITNIVMNHPGQATREDVKTAIRLSQLIKPLLKSAATNCTSREVFITTVHPVRG